MVIILEEQLRHSFSAVFISKPNHVKRKISSAA